MTESEMNDRDDRVVAKLRAAYLELHQEIEDLQAEIIHRREVLRRLSSSTLEKNWGELGAWLNEEEIDSLYKVDSDSLAECLEMDTEGGWISA